LHVLGFLLARGLSGRGINQPKGNIDYSFGHLIKHFFTNLLLLIIKVLIF
jgi:hypothetical protein